MKTMLIKIITTYMLIMLFGIPCVYSIERNISITKSELQNIGDLIFKNEASNKKELLIHWNDGEDFPSLGIGHFIWFPKDLKAPFVETLPSLIDFYKKYNVELPQILKNHQHAPWKTKTEFLKYKNSNEIKELENFLYNTRDIQVLFIYKRLEKSLEKMMNRSNNPKHIQFQFYRVANTHYGLYALIDYVNFKGEGLKDSEKYNNYGWGLLQVLENMQGTQYGESALLDFSNSAIMVLSRRIAFSPIEKNEERWLRGWVKRSLSYIN